MNNLSLAMKDDAFKPHEHSLASLVERLPVVVFRLDRALRHLYVNPAVETMTGWPPEDLVGRSALESGVDPELWLPFEAACRRVYSTAEPQEIEFSADLQHRKRHLECQLFPEMGAFNRVDTIIGLITDRTERKQVEDALRESEERYHALIANVKSYAIFALDLKGFVTTWNEGVQRLLGWSRNEFLGLPIEKLFSPEDVASGMHRTEMQVAAEEGSSANDLWLRQKEGTPFFASCIFSRAVDTAGHVIGFSVVLRDRTSWKRAQEERDKLLESERKVRHEAEQASRLKDEFLATLSHELRSPLNAIVGWVHIARRHSGDDNIELTRSLDTIERNVRAQTQIVNDLLDMSRIMTGQVRLELQTVDLRDAIGNAVESIRPSADTKRVRLETALDGDIGWTKVDPARLQQMLWNLLVNAVKFTPPGGRVRVALTRVNSHCEIIIEDSGVGVAPAFLPFVFERFRQADASTTRQHGGLGLGLSIVKSLAELHGGSVKAESPGEGQGSTFTVVMPIVQTHSDDGSMEARLRGNRSDNDPLPSLKGITVLVVDDEADSLMFFGRLLEECSARVLLAVDAQQAMETLQSERIDIMISDIGMAGADGYQLIQQVRALADDRISTIPAVAVTAYTRADDRRRLLLAGFQMHIAKPVEPQELVAGIASLIGLTSRKAVLQREAALQEDVSGQLADLT
ncbi:MAG: ATP-binding protein [Gammaproteobacteria bacterium]